MARFHVRTADGRLFEGAAAFSQLWRRLPGWRLLGWVCAMPPISLAEQRAVLRLFTLASPAAALGTTALGASRNLTRTRRSSLPYLQAADYAFSVH